ncbi:CapA family protein [Bacillus sp. SM2101]|uniref:CapA family protein n=1 Tax=Bacillus sp. SM2101 TaxID=2805366 RepID=UPI001BDEAEDC|nr:CapA family protein [Bacillus sp. SM2101]
MMYRKILFVSLGTTVTVCISIFSWFLLTSINTQSVQVVVNTHHNKTHHLSQKDFTTSLTIGAVGDILLHSTVYNDAKTSDGYDFTPMMSNVFPLLTKPDITFANQESMIGGKELGISTYPRFNSPYNIADTIKAAGVDIVSIANNHTLDRGERAVLNATAYYDKINMAYVGGYRSNQDKEQPRILVNNKISVGFLAYTYGTNGLPIPKGKEYLVNVINVTKIKEDIKKLRADVDVIVVSMHWGNEYERFPSFQQQELAHLLANEGADIIIGHHPHVLQPIEWIERDDSSKSIVVYSLGNFLSGQYNDYKDIGGLFEITVTKSFSGNVNEIHLDNPTFTPTYVSNQYQSNFETHILSELISSNNDHLYEQMYNDTMEHMYQWLDEQP